VCLVGGKAHQQKKRKPAHLKREKAQKHGKKREVRRIEEEKAACPAREKVQQEGWKRSSIEELRKREEHCGKKVPQKARLLDLGWVTEKVVVLYLTCKYGKKGSHVEDNWEQRMVLLWKWRKLIGVNAKRRQRRKQCSPERQKCNKVAYGQETWKVQPKRGVAKERSGEPSKC